MNIKTIVKSLGLVAGLVAASSAFALPKVDSNVPEYQRTSGISGNLSSVGSDTLANLMTLWAESFKKEYPNVNIQIQAAGSSTAPPALTNSTSNFGPMSRMMKDKEIQAFEKEHGYKPTAIRVAIDALAVYVNKDNPIQGLTIEQTDAIFSANRTCGAADAITRWGQAGLESAWTDRDIEMYGRNAASGTYGYFKEKALCKGDYSVNVKAQPGSASVVQSVATSLNGIGYSGIGYKTSGVRAVPLAKKAGDAFVEATPENALTGQYPLSRFLYVYVNKAPNKPLSPIEQEFLKLVLSQAGQNIVVKDGYIPVPASVVKADLEKVGITL